VINVSRRKLQSLYIVSNYKQYRTDEFLKTGSDVADLMSWRSLFQTEAAAMTKAQLPVEERRV